MAVEIAQRAHLCAAGPARRLRRGLRGSARGGSAHGGRELPLQEQRRRAERELRKAHGTPQKMREAMMTGDERRSFELSFANQLGGPDRAVVDQLFQRVFGSGKGK